MAKYVTVRSGRAFSGDAQTGYRARVEADGTVAAYDRIAGHYTTCHALTAGQVRWIRAQAQGRIDLDCQP